jgi:CHAT domain-containing protein
MMEFYRRLASGAEKAVALRQAKLEMIRRFGSYAMPYLWSGFVLVGDNIGRLAGRYEENGSESAHQ